MIDHHHKGLVEEEKVEKDYKMRKTSNQSDEKEKNVDDIEKLSASPSPSQEPHQCESLLENTGKGQATFILLFLGIAFGLIGKNDAQWHKRLLWGKLF